jgi:acyl carrier protein
MHDRVSDQRPAAHRHERLRDAGGGAFEPRPVARGEDDCLRNGSASLHRACILPYGASPAVRATFAGLAQITDASVPDRFERDTIDIIKRLSRRPVEPRPDNELLQDLGFDSLQVLELVGELEDHFNIAVPLNALTHIRTVGQIASEVRRLVEATPTAERQS